MSAALARALLLLVLPFLAAACPGPTANPCAGVTCAPGRVCVRGTCKNAEQNDLYVPFRDSGWQPSCDGQLDSESPAGRPDGPLVPPTNDSAVIKIDNTLEPELGKPDTSGPGHWFQANLQVCSTFCTMKGKANATSPDGALCMSGENRSASGMAQGIVFTYGCWPSCASANAVQGAASTGAFCYRPGQKSDGDTSDRTVGCFCREP